MTKILVSTTGSDANAGATASTQTAVTNVTPVKGGAIDIGTYQETSRTGEDTGRGATGTQADTTHPMTTTPPTPGTGGSVDIGLYDGGVAAVRDADQAVYHHLVGHNLLGQNQHAATALTQDAVVDPVVDTTVHHVDIGMYDTVHHVDVGMFG